MIDVSNIKSFAESFAKKRAFEFVENPEYRGPKMTKDRCAEFVARTAKTEAFLYFSDLSEQENEEIYNIAKVAASELLDNVNW